MTAAQLSHTERLGIALVRRAHALGGADLLRMVGTALVAFLMLDYVRLAISSPLAFGDAALVTAMDVVAYIAVGVALWRPVAGLALASIPLAASLVWTSTSLEVPLLVLATALGLAQVRRRTAAIASLALAGYVGVRTLAAPTEVRGPLGLTLGVALALGLVGGWTGLLLRVRREHRERTELYRTAENARIRADERRLLARELHDVVAHQLSTASLQVMGAHAESDPRALHRALDVVAGATAEALTELRLLVRVLRDDPATAVSGTEIRELAERVPPTRAAAAADLALLEAGFEPDIEVPARADDLAMTVQRTLSRVLHEATDNVIRHAPARSRCVVHTTITDQQVTLEVRNGVPPDAGFPALGWGLRGLQERIDLTGGSFAVAIADAEWVVTATLPLT